MSRLRDESLERRKKFRVWSQPKSCEKRCLFTNVEEPCGMCLPYGPSTKQAQMFIEQLEDRPHLHPLDIFLFDGGNRSGKCHIRGTELLRYDGTIVKVEDVKVGDLLMGPDSTPRKVLELGRGREMMYKVIPTKGDSFVCNASHILPLQRMTHKSEARINKDGTIYNKPIRYKPNWNVSIKDYIKASKRKKRMFGLWRAPAITFPNSPAVPLDPYFLGAWLGDGSASSPSITNIDKEVINHVYSMAKATSNLHVRKYKNTYYLTKGVYGPRNSNKYKQVLKDLNVLNNKHIPQMYKTASIEERLQLLAGLIDTDGYLANGTYFEITQKNEILAKDILFLARSLGFAAYAKLCKKSCTYRGEKRTGIYQRISISGDIHRIPTKIARKQASPIQRHQSVMRTGFTVEEFGIDDYFGVVLEDDHLYLMSDFTVTHNTVTAVARCIQYLLQYPGSTALIGAENLPILERSAKEEWRKRFSIVGDWDHPLVERKPTAQTKCLRLKNGSKAWFIHFSDYKVLRGVEADIIHIEEASLLPSEDSMNELVRRLSGKKGPIKQLILTTNPEESKGWIYEKFALKQFEPDYDGDPIPIGDKCSCNLCSPCLNIRKVKNEYVNGKCSACGAVKENICPGDQQFFRVIRTASFDNNHLPSDYVDNMRNSMSAEYYELYGEGKVVELRKGKIYKSYGKHNLHPVNIELDYNKPLIWSFDFNVSYQCSVICQERETSLGTIVDVIDEIIYPEAGPEHVAEEFLKRYGDYNGPITIYGDPAALNKKTSSNDVSQFQVVYDIITNPSKCNMPHITPKNATITVKKIKSQTQIKVVSRVESTNAMLKNANNEIRIYINPKCRYLILSLEDMRWMETQNDSSQMDTKCDKNAARSPNKRALHLLSHPTDALGYYIYKKFPITPKRDGNSYIQLPGERVVEFDNTNVREYNPYYVKDPPPPPKKRETLMDWLEMYKPDEPEGDLPFIW